MSNEVLLVGGHADGMRYRLLDENQTLIYVAQPHKVSYKEEPPVVVRLPDVSYYIHKLQGKHERFNLAAPADMPIDEVLRILIKGYRNGKS